MNTPSTSRFYYGYYIVAACFFILFLLWGMVLNTFPIFLRPMSENMNWGRGTLAIALLMGSIGTALSAPVAGIIIDRVGAKRVMIVGALLIGISLLIGSKITHLWQLYIVFAFIGCGLMCSTVIPCSLLIQNWFVSRRGTAMSAAFVGTSAGGMVMSPIANWIILNYGWRTAYVFSGITILVLAVPVIFFVIRTHPSEIGLEPYRNSTSEISPTEDIWGVGIKEAFSLKVFWQISAIMLIMAVVLGGIANHCVAYLTDLEHSPTRAAFAWSMVMGAMVIGKLSFGPVADRWGSKKSMALSCSLFAISIMILMFARPYWVVLIFASVYGFACGAPLVINPLLTSDYLGMKNFGAVYGVLNIMGTVGGAIGPVTAGFIFDAYNNYLPFFYVSVPLMLATAMIAILIKPKLRDF